MIYRIVIVVALLGIIFGACASDDPEQENQNQIDSQDVQDVSGQDPDVDGHLGEDADQSGADASSDEDVGAPEDVDDGDIGGGDVGDVEEDAKNGSTLEGDSCETAIDVTDGAALVGESTVEMNDNYDPALGADNCPGTNFSDRERVYVVAPVETTIYEVVAEPEDSFDLMLYAREDCAVDACVAGTRFNGAGGMETISFEVAGGESVFIFVDGEIGHVGEFDLMVTIEE